jgi:hypothetical protein
VTPGACPLLTPAPYAGTVYRAVRIAHLVTPLKYGHTRTVTTRFNPATIARPGFHVLYFSEDRATTLYEVNAVLGSPHTFTVPNPTSFAAWTTIDVDVDLSAVVDLRAAGELAKIATTIQELTGDWVGYAARPPGATAPTQDLGTALSAVPRLEGFLTYSARDATQTNLVVFPHNLRPGSSIRYTDGTGRAHTPIP